MTQKKPVNPRKSPKRVNKNTQRGDKKMTVKQEMILVDIAQCQSKRRPGTHFFRFTFIEPESFVKYEACIDPAMKNFNVRRWSRIIADFAPMGIYRVGVVKEKNRAGRYIINGDVQAQLVQRLTDSQLTWLITNLDQLHQNHLTTSAK